MGNPLPSGTVKIYGIDNDQLVILGENRISHTPVEEEVKLEIGKAFDIKAERKVLDRKKEGKNSEKMKIEVEFRNWKSEDVEILVTEPFTRRTDIRILSSNYDIHHKEAKHVEFIVPVKAKQTNRLEYEVLYTW